MPVPQQRRLSTLLALALLGGSAAVVVAAPASAAPGGPLLRGLTAGGHLVSFRAQTPGTAVSDVAVTGLTGGEALVGLDVRPANGDLVAVSDASRLYRLDPTTGAAALLSTVAPAFTGGAFSGVDFNPVPDRLRLVGSDDSDLRVNVATGVATVDGTIAYAAGDVNNGNDPAIGAAAYTNSFAGATATTLYDIDTTADALVLQNPPNNGTLSTVGALGVNVTGVAGLDIDAASGTAYAVLQTAAGTGVYTVDLTTGAATRVGDAVAGLVDATVATPRVRALPATVVEGSAATVTLQRTGDLADAATVDYATSDAGATAGSDYTATSGTASFAAGASTATVTVPTAGDLATEGPEAITLTLSNPSAGLVLSPAVSSIAITEPAVAYALTTQNALNTFQVSTPGTSLSSFPITGLAAGEDVVGMDVRPANGLLYAVTSASRLVTLDPSSGAATVIATLSTALSGTSFGVDVNPVADRLRVVSDTGQSLRIVMETGATTVDAPLNPGTPNVVGAAYTNDVAGAAATTLYDVDATTDTLYIQNPPNNGTLTAVGTGLGVDISPASDLDIAAAGGAAFGAFTPTGGAAGLYRVDLTAGTAVLAGLFADSRTEDLALASPGRLAAADATGAEGATATVTVTRTAGSAGPLSVDYATADTGTARSGTDFTATTGTVRFADGQTTATFTVPLLQDASLEGPESFPVIFNNPQGGTGAVAPVTVTITDDESGTAYGLTSDDRLQTFDVTAPAAAPTRSVALTGLGSGEHLLGIDVRPATGLLYGISTTGRVLALDPVTGDTQLVSTSSVLPTGTAFGVDVNPVADRLRVVSNTGQSLRINIDTGAATVDGTLAYAAGDPGAGSAPAVAAAGYTGSAPGATATVLYDIDTARDVLVRQDPPNSGTLNTVGPLGVDVTGVAGLDVVSPGDSAFALLGTAGGTAVYRVDLATGAARSLGAAGATLVDLALPAPVVAKAGRFHPLPPTRLLDTRTTAPALSRGTDLDLVVTGKGGIPSSGVSGVVLNVTAVGAGSATDIEVYPTGAKPTARTSNLNLQRGQTLAVQVQVGVGTGGAVSFSLSGDRKDLVVDVLGWYGDATDTAGLGYQPLTPQRVLDTRRTSTPLVAGSDQLLKLAGVAGVPSGAKAVALNVTVTGSTGNADVRLYPGGQPPAAGTSTINVVKGQTLANAAVATLGPDGTTALRVSQGQISVIVDVVGYYGATAAGRFVPITPTRLLDSRKDGGPVTSSADRTVVVAGVGSIPTGATAGVLSVTGTGATAPLHVVVSPTGTATVSTSTLNLVPRVDLANLAVSPLGTGGAVTLHVSQQSTNLVLDALGYFTAS